MLFEPKEKFIDIMDLGVGHTGIVSQYDVDVDINNNLIGHVILRTYDGFVSLSDPYNTWKPDLMKKYNIKVEPINVKIVEM